MKHYAYQKPVYSKETLKRWAEDDDKRKEYMNAHTNEMVKVREVSGYWIKCIQRKYDACMKKENEYGIQVFTSNPDTCGVEGIMDECVLNVWFNNCDDANRKFAEVMAMCY